jgi:hypothetical protein
VRRAAPRAPSDRCCCMCRHARTAGAVHAGCTHAAGRGCWSGAVRCWMQLGGTSKGASTDASHTLQSFKGGKREFLLRSQLRRALQTGKAAHQEAEQGYFFIIISRAPQARRRPRRRARRTRRRVRTPRRRSPRAWRTTCWPRSSPAARRARAGRRAAAAPPTRPACPPCSAATARARAALSPGPENTLTSGLGRAARARSKPCPSVVRSCAVGGQNLRLAGGARRRGRRRAHDAGRAGGAARPPPRARRAARGGRRAGTRRTPCLGTAMHGSQRSRPARVSASQTPLKWAASWHQLGTALHGSTAESSRSAAG